MAECQVCRAAVIVPRPLKKADGTWILVCNRCYHDRIHGQSKFITD